MLSDEMRETFHDWFEISTKEALFAEFDRWLTAHDAAVRADERKAQIDKNAAVLKRVLTTENGDRWSQGVDWARFHAIAAIRAQLTEGDKADD